MSETTSNGTTSAAVACNGTTPAPLLTGTALDHILAFLIPLFLRGTQGNEPLARRAAIQLLECYGAVTDSDFMLAAEVVAFGFTTLHNLGTSLADPAMSITTRLRLCSNANALSRAGERNRKRLERTTSAGPQHEKRPAQAGVQQPRKARLQEAEPQKTRPQEAQPQKTQPNMPRSPVPNPGTVQLKPSEFAMPKVRDAIVEAAPALAQTLANRSQTLSRQQRRFIERKAEQARVSQAREARKLARRAPSAAAAA